MKNNSFSIARVVTRGAYPEDTNDYFAFCRRAIQKICRECPGRVDVIQTPGGFIFDHLEFTDADTTGEDSTMRTFSEVARLVEENTAPELLTGPIRRMLQDKADYLTLGVDLWSSEEDCSKHAELVGTWDTRKERFTAWTGKSYPIGYQAQTLLYCMDMKTHAQMFGKTHVLVLGCHDLNMFSPRSQASTAPGTYKAKAIRAMQKLCDEFKPEVVLQHPHYTDSANIWMLGWVGVQRAVPSVHTFSSGIHYGNMQGGEPRQPLQSVLRGTRMGDVRDFIIAP